MLLKFNAVKIQLFLLESEFVLSKSQRVYTGQWELKKLLGPEQWIKSTKQTWVTWQY
jgi:hypothetical protein